MPSPFPQSSCLLAHYNGGDKASYGTDTLNGRGGHSCVCIVSPSARSPSYASRSMGEGETRTDGEASRTHSQGNRGGGGYTPCATVVQAAYILHCAETRRTRTRDESLDVTTGGSADLPHSSLQLH